MESSEPSNSDAYAAVAAALDPSFYKSQLGQSSPADPVAHYLEIGWRQGLDPTADFSTTFYLARSPDVVREGINPFHHYLVFGRPEGRAPSPAAAAAESDEVDPEIATVSAHLNRDFYLSAHPELVERHVDPVLHFCAYGWRAGWDPSPDFSTRYYLERSPDVAAANVNPFYHFLAWGRAEGRASSPERVDRAREPNTPEERLAATAFDADFYGRTYPGTVLAHLDPLKHFLHFGWRQGFDPSPAFSTEWYLRANPDVRASHENPFVHYLRAGRAEGRLPRPPDVDAEGAAALLRPSFDAGFYRRAYGLQGGDDELLRDYLETGWRSGRDPAPWFSTDDYQRRYPGTASSGLDPFTHFLVWGRDQGFSPGWANAPTAIVTPGHELVRSPQLRATLKPRAERRAGPVQVNSDALDIHWLVPDPDGPGMGGHLTVLRMVRWLELFGHRCTLWINDPDFRRDRRAREDLILGRYQFVRAEIRLAPRELAFPADAVVIATSWETAHLVAAAPGGAAKMYFVQDDESSFHPAGAWAFAAEATYDLDLGHLCAGAWLEQRLQNRGRWVRRFDLAPDERFVPPAERPSNDPPRVAFYAREHTSRRAVELGLLALEHLAASGARFHVDFFGSHAAFPETPFPSTCHGVLDADALARLFGACDIGLCLSATNYSLAPLDMMACGLPVVELDGETTRAAYPDGVVARAQPTPQGVAGALARLLADPVERAAQAERASAWVAGLSWEASARAVEAGVRERLVREGAVPRRTPTAGAPSAPLASVVIPTFNGGPLFGRVLDAVLAQRAPWPFEVLVIDSTSTDGTWDRIRERGEAVRSLRIPQSQFQHGRTRNLAVEQSRGDFIALLTQDALPADPFWLYNLVETLRRFPLAAGAFGRHLAWPDASPFTRRDIEAHFSSLAAQPLVTSRHLDPARWRSGDEAFRRRLHFFSDNNACLRRSVWTRHSYPEVDFGEDQIWAAEVIKAGYAIAYAPSARVWHSHDYDEAALFDRMRIEAAVFRDAFGYAPPDEPADEQVRRMNLGDEIWGARNGVSPDAIAHKHRLNAAEVAGRLAGYNDPASYAPGGWAARSASRSPISA